MSLHTSAALIALMLGITYGQEPTGVISGTITDSSGAIVQGVTITVTDKATGNARTAITNSDGLYSVPALLPGEYEGRVEGPGFRTVVREAQVLAGSTTTVDLQLTPGAAQEVVTVEAAAIFPDSATSPVR